MNFINRAKIVHKNKYRYDNTVYVKAHQAVKIICPIHGEFEQRPYSHLNGQGCISCSGKVKKTTNTFITEAKNVHKDKYKYHLVNYKNNTTRVKIKCPVHGVFYQIPKDHLKGKGCRKCGDAIRGVKARLTLIDFKNKANQIHNNKYVYTDTVYVRGDDKIKILCPVHGLFTQQAGSHIQGHGCFKCATTSKGEDKIRTILRKLNIINIEQYSIGNILKYKYDFYLPDYNLLIEYDGKQHYVINSWGGITELNNIKKRDTAKNSVAKKHNIDLIRIPYWEYRNIDKILEEKLKMKKVIDGVNQNTVFTAVCYTDGACGPTNPGLYGSGVHGYIYREEDIDVKHSDNPPGNNNITTIGYDNKPINNNKSVKLVKPYEYINAMFCFGYEISTNNVAEIVATIKIIRYLLDHHYSYKSIIIKTDSSYTEGIFHKLMNKELLDYNHTEVPNLKNAEYYDIIDSIVTELKEKNIELIIKKVKGHSDSLGNNLADALAVAGRLNGDKGVEGDFVKFYPGNKYWKPNINKHPLLRINQLFYTHQDRKILGTNKYVIMDYDKDIEIGKKTHGAMFGIIELNDINASEIEAMINIDKDNMNGLSILSSIDLTVYYSQFHNVYKELCGNLAYTSKKNHIEVMGTEPIITPVYPQGLAKASLDKALMLDDSLQSYKKYKDGTLKDSDELFYLDITENIYDLSGKSPKIKLDTNDKLLKVTVNLFDKDKVLIIPLKRELVDRNTLKQLEKDNPKIYVEVTVVNSKTITYNTIVDIGDEIGVYTNFYTTTTIL